MKQGFVYIMSNKNRTTIYIGVTNNLERRTLEHKSGHGSVFTKRYNLHDLLYYEEIMGMQNAIDREKQLKNWHKDWKWNLIKEENPELKDLAEEWFSKEEIEDYKQMRKDSELRSSHSELRSSHSELVSESQKTLKQVQDDTTPNQEPLKEGESGYETC